jgi:predicted AAA+ superfamily ATPase
LPLIKRYLKIDVPKGQSCFLWGARKTGKSTYLHAKFKKGLFIDLLESRTFQQYLQNPSQLEGEILANPDKTVIIIDEVQKIPALLDEVHRLIELYKNKQFILCGSSARRLKSTGANLLGGRAWRFLFLPFCYIELKELNWKKIFNNGLIPSHYLAKKNVQKSLAAYLFDYILPEVQFEANLRKKENFARFLDLLGFCNGELINYNNIARDVGVDSKTVRTYFEILVDMYLGYYIHPYNIRSNRQVISNMPKFYLFDVGIANFLKRYEFKEMIGEEAGKAFEHYILLELMAYKALCDKRDDIYFWRTREGYEVDFIFQNNAFEVKISTPIQKSHLKGLLEFSKEHHHNLHVISMEPRKRMMKIEGKDIIIWPVKEFLDQLWNHHIM